MKILFLCTYYHRAMIFRDAMNNLISNGHKVKAFNAVAYDSKIDEKYKGIMDELVIHKECFNRWDRFLYHVKQKKIYNALLSSCNIKDYDIVHSHMLFNGGYVAYLLKKHFGVPYIVSVRNTDINVFLKIPIFVKIANNIIKEASGIQFLSPSYKETFINTYVRDNLKDTTSSKSIVINNGLENFWLENKSEVKTISNIKTINIICVGKIDKNKNITTAIKAIKILKGKGHNVNFTVVGQVRDKAVLNEIKEESFVRVINYLTKEELINVYRDNDIYLMPSISESFGRVYAEAMTQGLPVIYTKGQGFDGIFEDGHVGYSVPSNDEEYISSCILKIIDNYQDISRRCVYESGKFDWKIIAEELNQFYLDSLERGRS
ncbi:glycosyltransferase family 4 protein [Sutcliffiella horikoshii]|uniref:glycosyltransferase family 4 protein n=1 Tax=Sutcliffiella horikoshii TaxID=79883 RepID=UPI00384EF916